MIYLFIYRGKKALKYLISYTIVSVLYRRDPVAKIRKKILLYTASQSWGRRPKLTGQTELTGPIVTPCRHSKAAWRLLSF